MQQIMFRAGGRKWKPMPSIFYRTYTDWLKR
jgi:hypothetical protein